MTMDMCLLSECVQQDVIFLLLFSSAIHDHLMSDDVLSFVASHIGIGDLMLCAVSNVPLVWVC